MGKSGGGTPRHLGRIARQMANQNVGIDKRRQRRRPTRSLRVRRNAPSHPVPRLPAGTLTVPASSRKFGVLAIRARQLSTRKTSSSRDVAFVARDSSRNSGARRCRVCHAYSRSRFCYRMRAAWSRVPCANRIWAPRSGLDRIARRRCR